MDINERIPKFNRKTETQGGERREEIFSCLTPCALSLMERHIIHLHVPAFSIAVARVSQPELRQRPVAVAPLQSERALLLSVSHEARTEGIFKGMPLVKAKKRCPGLTVLPPNPELTEKASRTLTRWVARITPLWERSRAGHIYLDVTGTERLWGRAKETGYRLTREVKDRFFLPGTVGVAGNKMVSRIASQMISTEGVLDVDHGQEASFVAPFKVSVLPGIGHFRQRVLLEELNIVRVRELAALDMGNLRMIFGRHAYRIHQRALGIDPTPVYPTPIWPAVSEEITLSQDENDDYKLLGVLYTLVEKCSQRMRKRALFPRKTGLLIRYSDQTEVKRQLKLPRLSFWEFDLHGPLESLFYKACKRRVRVRFMKVWFWDFLSSSGQLSLFHAPTPDSERQRLAVQALDRIRERYGGQAIQFGQTVDSGFHFSQSPQSSQGNGSLFWRKSHGS